MRGLSLRRRCVFLKTILTIPLSFAKEKRPLELQAYDSHRGQIMLVL